MIPKYPIRGTYGTAVVDVTEVNLTLPVNAQTGTAYTILVTDNNKWITLNNAGTITVTVPRGLPLGFSCILNQIGAGTVTIAGASGVTINNIDTHTDIAGQYGVVSLFAYAADTFNLMGATA